MFIHVGYWLSLYIVVSIQTQPVPSSIRWLTLCAQLRDRVYMTPCRYRSRPVVKRIDFMLVDFVLLSIQECSDELSSSLHSCVVFNSI